MRPTFRLAGVNVFDAPRCYRFGVAIWCGIAIHPMTISYPAMSSESSAGHFAASMLPNQRELLDLKASWCSDSALFSADPAISPS